MGEKKRGSSWETIRVVVELPVLQRKGSSRFTEKRLVRFVQGVMDDGEALMAGFGKVRVKEFKCVLMALEKKKETW